MSDQRLYLAQQLNRILLASIDRNIDVVATTLSAVGVEYGHDGMFSTCNALAEVVRQIAFPHLDRGDGSLTGEMVIPRGTAEPGDARSAAGLWAARFVASYINGDRETSRSLFYGALGSQEQTLRNVCALVAMAGDIARQVEHSSPSISIATPAASPTFNVESDTRPSSSEVDGV